MFVPSKTFQTLAYWAIRKLQRKWSVVNTTPGKWKIDIYDNIIQWKRISCKPNDRWQHLFRLKARALFFLQKNIRCMKRNNLYSGLVTPSSGWWSPIVFMHRCLICDVPLRMFLCNCSTWQLKIAFEFKIRPKCSTCQLTLTKKLVLFWKKIILSFSKIRKFKSLITI